MVRSAERRFLRYVVLCFLSLCFVLALYSPIYQQTQQRESMVQGWEVNVSRDTGLYVRPENNTSVIASADLCRTKSSYPLLLLVVVCSAVPHFDRRNAIRETWASNLNPDVRVAFLLGGTDNTTLQVYFFISFYIISYFSW